jgi:hypothetical protein
MDGQSHRARLREVVDNSGGQQYDPHGSDNTPRQRSAAQSTRGGTASRGGRGGGGGVVGTRGRGTPTSLGRSGILHELIMPSNTLTTCTSSITPAIVANRPLDPAIDVNDPKSKYRFGRGNGQSSRGSHQDNRSPARGSTTSGRGLCRGGRAQDVRATIVGTTVRVTAASERLPRARQLAANSQRTPATLAVNPTPKEAARPAPPARVPPVLQDNEKYYLDPAAFLAAIANKKDRETFNKMIPPQPKPAPASKAAEVVAKPSKKVEKTFNELVQSTPKPALPSQAVDIVASLNLLKKEMRDGSLKKDAQRIAKGPKAGNPVLDKPKLEKPTPDVPKIDKSTAEKPEAERAKAKIPNAANFTAEQDEERRREERKLIRQVPTHEFAFPPPFSRSTRSVDNNDAYTDGVPSPAMTDFSASPEYSPAIGSANTIREDNNTGTTELSAATLEATAPVVGLGISVRPGSGTEVVENVSADLLMLGTEEVVHQPAGDHGSGASLVRDTRAAGAVADLMDLDISDIPWESLTLGTPQPEQEAQTEPNQESKAKSVEPPAYFDVGGIRYFREDHFARPAPSEAAAGNTPTVPVASAPAATDRVITGSGYTIGVRHLGLHDGDLLGERNLPRRAQENLTTPTLNSIWAARPTQSSGKRRVRRGSPVRVEPELSLPVDPRPSAIRGQNLPRRTHEVVSRNLPATASGESSQAEDSNARPSTQHLQGRTMPVEANPWSTSHTIVPVAARANNFAESQWGEPTARGLTHLSDGTPEGRSETQIIDRSSETAPSSLSEESIFSQNQELRPSRSQLRSSTSDNTATSNVKQIERIVKQDLVSMRPPSSQNINVAGSSATGPQHETEQQRMVRLMNSHGSDGMTPLTVECPSIESRQRGDSVSSSGHSRASSRSQCSTVTSTTNLARSLWAVEEAATTSTATRPSARSASIASHVPSAKQSNIRFMRHDGKIRTRIARTNAGPGFELLKAEADARAAVSNSQEAAAAAPTPSITSIAPAARSANQVLNTNTRATFTTSSVEAQSSTVSLPSRQTLGTQTTAAGRLMTSTPEARIIHQVRPRRSPAPAMVQRGRGSFQYRSNNGDSSSDESEL